MRAEVTSLVTYLASVVADSLSPICLPNVDMKFTSPQPCWIVGFGRTSEGGRGLGHDGETESIVTLCFVCVFTEYHCTSNP